jgi:hypothetical protein
MVCLVVGLDRRTLSPWYTRVRARDVGSAKLAARARARRLGIDVVVAAAIGPAGSVVRDPDELGPRTNAA